MVQVLCPNIFRFERCLKDLAVLHGLKFYRKSGPFEEDTAFWLSERSRKVLEVRANFRGVDIYFDPHMPWKCYLTMERLSGLEQVFVQVDKAIFYLQSVKRLGIEAKGYDLVVYQEVFSF